MQETDFPFELIIGEDGSTDGTREICIEYANKYPDKIRLFLRDRGLTQYVTKDNRIVRFNGLFTRSEARAEYIAICEGDDYWIDKGKLEVQLDIMSSRHDIVLVFSGAEVIGDSVEELLFSNVQERYYTNSEIIDEWLISTASVMFRRSAYVNCNIAYFLDPKIIYGDLLLWLSLAQYGKIYCLQKKMVCYRRHSGSMSSSFDLTRVRQMAEMYEQMARFFGGKYRSNFQKKLSWLYLYLSIKQRLNISSLKLLFLSFKTSPAVALKAIFNYLRKLNSQW